MTEYGPNYDGTPAQYSFTLANYNNSSIYPVSLTGSITTTAKGTYQFPRVPPGQYVLNILYYGSASSPQSQSAYTFVVAGPGADTSSSLQGQYAFLLSDKSRPGASAAVGSFTADGTGKITSGVLDATMANGSSFTKLSLTGTYRLNAAGQGTATLNTSQGTISLSLFVPVNQTLTNITSATVMASAGSLVTGSGMLMSQSSVNPAFAPTLNTGVQAALMGQTGPNHTPIAGSTQFTFLTSSTVTASGQLAVGGGPVPFSGLQGIYSPLDSTTGRTTLSFAIPGQPSMTYVAYKVSDAFFTVMSLGLSGGTLLTGTAEK